MKKIVFLLAFVFAIATMPAFPQNGELEDCKGDLIECQMELEDLKMNPETGVLNSWAWLNRLGPKKRLWVSFAITLIVIGGSFIPVGHNIDK